MSTGTNRTLNATSIPGATFPIPGSAFGRPFLVGPDFRPASSGSSRNFSPRLPRMRFTENVPPLGGSILIRRGT